MITDYTRLINKEHPLPSAYVPHGLVDLGLPFTCTPSDPRRLLEKKAAHAAMDLITRASQEGISLYCISGYRSYARQKELYRHTAYVAAPGTSEHQSGLALACCQYGAYRSFCRYIGRYLACPPCTALWFYPSLPGKQRIRHTISL